MIESNDSNNWEQMGRDIESLQRLIKQLEEAKKNEKQDTTEQGEDNIDSNLQI